MIEYRSISYIYYALVTISDQNVVGGYQGLNTLGENSLSLPLVKSQKKSVYLSKNLTKVSLHKLRRLDLRNIRLVSIKQIK
jgi:hypothetical protein